MNEVETEDSRAETREGKRNRRVTGEEERGTIRRSTLLRGRGNARCTRKCWLRCGPTEGGRKAFGNATQSDRDPPRRFGARIPRQSQRPGETIMGTLGAGKRRGSGGKRRLSRLYLNFYVLVTKQVDAGAPVILPTPVLPEERSSTSDHWMPQQASLARLCHRAPIPLTPLTQQAGATIADACRVHHT